MDKYFLVVAAGVIFSAELQFAILQYCLQEAEDTSSSRMSHEYGQMIFNTKDSLYGLANVHPKKKTFVADELLCSKCFCGLLLHFLSKLYLATSKTQMAYELSYQV